MSKKTFTVLMSYAVAAIAVLGIYSWVAHRNLGTYRLASKHSSMLAFEETVKAVSDMSEALEKSVYATDGAMCAKLCAEIYADAMAAEAALSTLPFATVELEEISGYLNQLGDYAYSLCAGSTQEGFGGETVEKLGELSGLAAGLADALRELQGAVHEGSIIMDRRERELINVGLDNSVGRVSDELLRFEAEFPHRSTLSYDGKYSDRDEEESAGQMSDAQMLAVAARYAGVSPGEMRVSYEYEGSGGRKCYSVGEKRICVDGRGVESMSGSRLVYESRIGMEKARELAEGFLEKQGFDSLRLMTEREEGCLGRFSYARVEGEVLMPDRYVNVSVALDDGSIYSFSRENYSDEPAEAVWSVSEEQARQSLPPSLSAEDCAKVLIESEGGEEKACWLLDCLNEKGESVRIYVDAATGLQSRIEL